MMIYHQEDKHPNIRLDVYIQADMRMLRFELQDYIASFSFTYHLKLTMMFEIIIHDILRITYR